MGHTFDDFRGALRTLVRAPVFAIAAVLSLAIGIGANTAIFSVASALLLRPLPYQDADRLVILWNRSPGIGIAEDWFSTGQYFDIKHGHAGFEERRDRDRRQLEPHRRRRARTRRHDPGVVEPAADARRAAPRSASCSRRTTIGRAAPGKALLSYGTWMRRFGGDPRVLGRSLDAQRPAVRSHRRPAGVASTCRAR